MTYKFTHEFDLMGEIPLDVIPGKILKVDGNKVLVECEIKEDKISGEYLDIINEKDNEVKIVGVNEILFEFMLLEKLVLDLTRGEEFEYSEIRAYMDYGDFELDYRVSSANMHRITRLNVQMKGEYNIKLITNFIKDNGRYYISLVDDCLAKYCDISLAKYISLISLNRRGGCSLGYITLFGSSLNFEIDNSNVLCLGDISLYIPNIKQIIGFMDYLYGFDYFIDERGLSCNLSTAPNCNKFNLLITTATVKINRWVHAENRSRLFAVAIERLKKSLKQYSDFAYEVKRRTTLNVQSEIIKISKLLHVTDVFDILITDIEFTPEKDVKYTLSISIDEFMQLIDEKYPQFKKHPHTKAAIATSQATLEEQ